MRGLKQHFGLLSLMSTIVLWLVLQAFINCNIQESPYGFRTIKGDSRVLDEIVVKGIIRDRDHEQSFILNNRDSEVAYKMNEHHTYIPISLVYQKDNVLVTEGREFHYDWEKANYSVESKSPLKLNIRSYNEWMAIYTHRRPIVLNLEDKDYENYKLNISEYEGSSKHYLESELNIPSTKYAMAFIEKSLFFTVNTIPGISGESGVYEIIEWGDYFNRKGEIRTIDQFFVEEENIRVLGLHAIDTTLLLLMIVEDTLTIRSYDAGEGELVNELKIMKASQLSYYDILKFYNDGNRVHILFQEHSIDSQVENIKLITVEVKDKAVFEQLNMEVILDYDYELIQVDHIFAIEDKIFLFVTMRGKELTSSPTRYNVLFVYNQEELMYQGEFVTFTNQDYNSNRWLTKAFYGINYGNLRFIDQMVVETRVKQ